VGICAAIAGVAIGHYAWTPSSSKPTQTANRELAPFKSGSGGVQYGRNGSFNYRFPGGSFSYNGEGGGFSYSGPGGSFNSGGSPGGSSSGSSSNGVSSSVTGKVDPGLVDINTQLVDNEGEAAGTGMVITSNGEVFTNNHVIAGATSITATDLGNGKTYTARVVGYDYHHDVAVLQLENASGLKTVSLGDSSTLKKGQNVSTIGNAGGVGGTPTAAGGQITALGQSITAQDEVAGTDEHLTGLIGINGDLQPGDSGGPLVDSSGDVVGMDTAASSTFVFSGQNDQGFAIPIDEVESIASQILAGQSSDSIHIGATGFLGVLVESASNGSAGAYIERTVSGDPAAEAGLTGGDTITALDGSKVSTPEDLTELILQHHPGDQVTVTYTTSSGSTETATITLGTGPAQ
jgi:S1-C subfamily serine protease